MRELQYFLSSLPLETESGRSLPGFRLAYQTFGTLNSEKSNAVWIVHALTGNSDPTDWWSGIVNENGVINPRDHYIVCVNSLGSAYGSTSPLSINPSTGYKYYHDFPFITNRDIARSFDRLRIHLGIESIEYLIGPSLGGQQALEWAIEQPEVVKNLILIATNAKHSAYGIAFNESQRLAIQADSTWLKRSDEAGSLGLKAARAIALLSYRTSEGYHSSQNEENDKIDDYRASSYQRYQGEKLVKRFNAFSYWVLSKAMDSHNVGRGRKSIEEALSRIQANTTIIGINSDILFPTREQKRLSQFIPNSTYYEISSLYGHDGFLTENDQMVKILESALRNNKSNFLSLEQV